MRELSNAEVNLVSGGLSLPVVTITTSYGDTLLFGPCTFQNIFDQMFKDGNMKTSGESSR